MKKKLELKTEINHIMSLIVIKKPIYASAFVD